MSSQLRVHSFLPLTYANGPGARCALWLQGCSLGCAGCFNADTHSFSSGQLCDVADVFSQIQSCADVEGITISGGEPLQQADALIRLMTLIKQQTTLSVLLFSGFSFAEITSMSCYAHLEGLLDVLIAGRFEQNNLARVGLIGSSNKTVHFFSDRYSAMDLEQVPLCEAVISADGEVVVTGIDPVSLR